ncbi:hypothetical protein SAMD00019534_003020 [Acytostelium subglobosum LB1]|uniref:hypothetical protein n=1 Tax=Acytostelium subglobosum LB1 TaxID=1410327 RepID=UPI000645197D|nr:hypothetical protein SAMD00019534_003020 [Acytostelium subglobosum LB1]GAM17127.1 hypothetical protein SAMD00019534_003020 [Acytostelium subglobosum LB1]|eukprot:XP_012759189.1 hypothetical protein SAMD00019534_003020 [Acytostelium subglobosum LB1]
MCCAAIGIKDPIEVIANFEPDKEDIGIMVCSVIGCIPVVGPLLQGVFTMYWRRANPEEEKVTKADLERRLKEFKEEILVLIGEKIKDSEIKQWIEQSESQLKGLGSFIEEYREAISMWQHKISERTDSDTQSLSNFLFFSKLHESIKELRHYCKQMMAFAGHPNYVKYVYKFFIQATLLYQMSVINTDAYWYQMKFDQIYVTGKPASGQFSAVQSFREKLHNHTVEALKTMADGWNNYDRHSGECKGIENANLILNSDLYYYPIPLIIGNHPKLANLFTSSETPVIELPDHPYPYIYRVDGASMGPDPHEPKGRRLTLPKDPITQCDGTFYYRKPSITIKLKRGRKVRVRLFGQYHHTVGKVVVSNGIILPPPAELEPVQEAIGIVPLMEIVDPMLGEVNTKWTSGFTQTEKYNVNDTMTFTLYTRPSKDSKYVDSDRIPADVLDDYTKVFFIEFIVSDI